MKQSRRQARLERRQVEKRRGQLKWLGFISAAAVVAAALLIYSSQVRSPDAEHTYTQKNGDQLGNPEAPVLVIEYGDFQCLHCLNFFTTTESLLIENHVNTGEILFEYRLVDYGGPESGKAAEATYCAADQDMFWEYHDVVFSNYSSGNAGGYSESRLIDFAQSLNLDIESFSACLQNGEKSGQIAENVSAAAAHGVNSTPSFLVNGALLVGNLPYSELQSAIAAAGAN